MGLGDTRDPNSLSTRLRRRRDIKLRELIASIAGSRRSISILDMGGTVEYWERVGIEFLREHGAVVTLINRSPNELSDRKAYSGIFRYAVGDACDLSQFPDKNFDLAHSNSVIEHVYTWSNMKLFAAETRRVARFYYVQTPYFWFPIDPHYYKMPLFHWLPRPTRAWLLSTFSIAHSGRMQTVDAAYDVVDAARLLDRRQFRFLFPDGTIAFERFVGHPKSMIGIRGTETS